MWEKRTRSQFERAIVNQRRERGTLPVEYLIKAVEVLESDLETAKAPTKRLKLLNRIAELKREIAAREG